MTMILARLTIITLALGVAACAPNAPATIDVEPASTEAPRNDGDEFRHYFGDRTLDAVEGVWSWDDDNYRIAIMRNDAGVEQHYDYVGVIVSDVPPARRSRQTKIFLNSTVAENIFTGVYFDDSGHRQITSFVMENTDLIRIHSVLSEDDPLLDRVYPRPR
jgi:hypothetical protein